MKLILGAGFLGSKIGEYLALRGYDIRGFSRGEKTWSFPCDYIRGDFRDIARYPEVFHGIDLVIHCIHNSIPAVSDEDLHAEAEANLLPTLNLLDMMKSHDIRSLIYLSSGGAVYGQPNDLPVREDAPTSPISGYGLTKLVIEQYLSHFYLRGYLDRLIILRPSNVYGHGQCRAKLGGAVAHLIRAAQMRAPFTVWGDGSACKDYLHVEDLCCAVLKVIEGFEIKRATFNISTGVSTKLSEVITLVEAAVGERIELRFEPRRCGDVQNIVLDNHLARTQLAWKPSVSLTEGIENTIRQAASSPV